MLLWFAFQICRAALNTETSGKGTGTRAEFDDDGGSCGGVGRVVALESTLFILVQVLPLRRGLYVSSRSVQVCARTRGRACVGATVLTPPASASPSHFPLTVLVQ
jgi:hypothetical protein